ncbi:acyl-CoA dehydrogenase [Variovorax boronicumulans]|uniref:Acyl-CoA dehydrogenase n=1 Tax=Variovorax boronicumulans TaxID=436515 RepID=A0A250DNM9_9BURK|nr:acyl-CoA dehydrogenase family protein [Variovorax boronicumulans]ATA55543.1 acyl-CoA dehydrogenase [Variovorax boronicumulans]
MPLWTEFEPAQAVNEFRAFAETYAKPAAAQLDRDDAYPSDVVEQAAKQGLNALIVPQEYGGGGCSFRRVVSFFEEIGVASASVGISLNSNFQAQNAILRSGNEKLKNEFLPKFSQGLTAAYALTEQNHGSDIRSLDTKAVLENDHWILSGQKSFITSGSGADLFIILAQTEKGLGVFAVPREIPGVSTFVGERSETFGGRNGPHVELKLENVRLPYEYLLGEPGGGLKVVLRNLNYSRTLNAAMVIGMARAAFDESLAYVKNRKAFGQSVFDFQGIQWYFAEMLTDIDAARLLLYSAADALEAQREPERYASEAKLFCCSVANRVTSQAIQVCGAYGTAVNSPFNRYWRDAKVAEIGGGSVEILKNTIGKYIGRMELG